MPLNRQLEAEAEMSKSKSAADFTNERQHARSGGVQQHDRPFTPQNPSSHGRSESRGQPTALKNNVSHMGKYGLDSDGIDPADTKTLWNGYKAPVPNTMSAHQPVKISQQAQLKAMMPPQKTQKSNTSSKAHKAQQKNEGSRFDDTQSLDGSFLDDLSHDDGPTVILKQELPLPTRSGGAQRPQIRDQKNIEQAPTYPNPITATFGDNWPGVVAREKEIQREKHGYATNSRQNGIPSHLPNLAPSGDVINSDIDFDDQLDTPSRAHSVPPPQPTMHAPAPRRNVGFAAQPTYFGDSPSLRSAEIAAEDSPIKSVSRPNSAEPTVQRMAFHQKLQAPQSAQMPSNHRNRQGQSGQVLFHDRFHHMAGHLDQSVHREAKVSAPESDIQDSSEDERARVEPDRDDLINPFGPPAAGTIAGKKRSYDESNRLDYDSEDLKHKNLSELQTEPFIVDPRVPLNGPPRDNHGNEMTWPQIPSNLNKVSEEAQRETFRTQTDEQWAETGQWFVDQFQADLKELMQVRLDRRKVALKYENLIRQRQREIEHQRSGLDKELQELQVGGLDLLKDRKAPGGSRSSTPMKPAKP